MLDAGVALCQVETAGGADGGVICSAAGGWVKGVGVIDATGDVLTKVGVIVGAEVGVNGGACGTRLVGFKIWALWTVDPPPTCEPIAPAPSVAFA